MRKLDISDSLSMQVFLTSKSLERLAEAEMKTKLGLTGSNWKIILALNLNDGLSQKELAEKIYVDGSNLDSSRITLKKIMDNADTAANKIT